MEENRKANLEDFDKTLVFVWLTELLQGREDLSLRETLGKLQQSKFALTTDRISLKLEGKLE